MVTLETLIIRIKKFSRIELYIQLSNVDVTLSMALLYSKFQIFSCPQVLPPLPQLTEISEMLTIPNYYRPPISDFNLNCQPLSYLTSPCNWSLEHRFSRPKLKFR